MDTLISCPPRLNKPRFVELLGRTNFSFLQGASHPEEMVEQALRYGYHGIAICDLDGLYGIVRGYQTFKAPSHFMSSIHADTDFKYLVGSELTVQTDEISTNKSKDTDETKEQDDMLMNVAMLPMNKDGYTQLCALLTKGKRQARKGFSRLSIQDLIDHNENLIAIVIPPFRKHQIEKLLLHFKDRLYLPVWRDLTWESQINFNEAQLLSEELGIKLFVTQRPFMHHSDRKPLFDVLTCAHHHCKIDEAQNILLSNRENCLKSLEKLYQIWQDRPDLIENSYEIASRITFSLEELRYRYPRSQLPDSISTPTDYLRELVEQGIIHRYPQRIPQHIRNQIEHELSIIKDLEYEDYFLTLYEICVFAREKNILFQGRGSAANSVVCFALGLTAVDPAQIDLLFERFISRERNEPPDIDIDFEHERREEVIQHIYEKYTEAHAAMVCTVVRFRSRMAFRETAKVFGLDNKLIDRLVKHMGRDGIARLLEPDVAKKFDLDLDTFKIILDLAQQIKGFPRHLGIHTGGFLITQDPINQMVPVEKATMEGRYVIQWNKDDVNFLKMMKLDILSLGILSALRKSLDLLRQHKNLNYELYSLPADCKKTYDMICRAETTGVFQIESRAQMQTLPRMLPRNFYDLVVEVALVRPGPLQGGMVHPFLKRRQGLEKVIYPHKDLEPILKKTFGVPIFQEQIMKIAVAAAGFTPGEADELRRILASGWTRQGLLRAVREKIMSGLIQHGITPQYAEQIYKTIEGFSSYGFPESHAASFALLTYASCWLKCHHPEIYVTSLLNSQPMGFYSPRSLIAEAQRNHVRFLHIDINKSDFDYKLENDLSVRAGFRALHSLSLKHCEQFLQERQQNGEYKNLQNFIERNPLPKATLLKLAAAGAFSETVSGASPRELMWSIEGLNIKRDSLDWSESVKPSNNEKNMTQFIPFESNWNKLERNYQQTGFDLDNHPMKILRPFFQKNSSQKKYAHSGILKNLSTKTRVRVAGLLSTTQRPPTAKGFCFLTLEDEFGSINVVVPPDIYQKFREVIYTASLIEITGTLEKNGIKTPDPEVNNPVINIRADSLHNLSVSLTLSSRSYYD